MNWRKWNNIIHRDLGYLCFGLTIIYVISGVAVNHIADYNPSYNLTRETTTIAWDKPPKSKDAFVRLVLEQLGETGALKDSFQPDAKTLQIFVENNTVTVNLQTGNIIQEKTRKRPLLYEANFLHLNHAKKLWTWFADLYALALGVLAITGLFVLRGKKGISGRGAWLVAIGLVIPLFFLWLYM